MFVIRRKDHYRSMHVFQYLMVIIVTCFHMLLEQALTFLQDHVRSR